MDINKVDWDKTREQLNDSGWAILTGVLNDAEADAISARYLIDDGFRSTVVMARHGFGRGASPRSA
jgi:uncharacterized protein